MLNFIISFGFVGIIFSAIVIPYFLFVNIMFVVYKLTKGKMNYREYMKHW